MPFDDDALERRVRDALAQWSRGPEKPFAEALASMYEDLGKAIHELRRADGLANFEDYYRRHVGIVRYFNAAEPKNSDDLPVLQVDDLDKYAKTRALREHIKVLIVRLADEEERHAKMLEVLELLKDSHAYSYASVHSDKTADTEERDRLIEDAAIRNRARNTFVSVAVRGGMALIDGSVSKILTDGSGTAVAKTNLGLAQRIEEFHLKSYFVAFARVHSEKQSAKVVAARSDLEGAPILSEQEIEVLDRFERGHDPVYNVDAYAARYHGLRLATFSRFFKDNNIRGSAKIV